MNKLRNTLLGAGAFVAAALLAGQVSAQPTNSTAQATTPVTANVVRPIAITGGDTLNFGTITSSVAGGTVVIDPAVGAETVRALSGVTSPDSTFSVGTFNVTGVGGDNTFGVELTYASTTPATGVTLGSPTSAGCNKSGAAFTVDAAGTCTLRVGGTLTVAPNAPGGAVNTTMQAVVTYN